MSGPIRPALRVEEQDGTPSVRPVNTIKVTNGTLTDDGSATVSITTGGGGGGGSMDNWDLAADTGSVEVVDNGETVTISGSGPISTEVAATNKVSISMAAATTLVDGYLTSTDWNTFNSKGSGTVTSVTGTAPVSSSEGTTPAISMAAASTLVDGYLTTTDWNTFNSKGSGTVTSVTGTAPVSSSEGTTPAISMAAATTSVDGYLTTTDWDTFNDKQTALTLSTTGTSGASTLVGGTLNIPQYSGGGGGAPTDASYVVLGVDGTLSAERVLTAGTGITLTDAGAGSTLTIDADQGDVTGTGSANNLAYWTGTDTISDSANFSVDAPSGTLDVFSYVEAGSNRIGSGGSKNEVTTISATDLVLNTNTGTNSGSITIVDGTDGDIEIFPDGTGLVKINDKYTLPGVVTTVNDYVLTAQTDGSTAWAEAGAGSVPDPLLLDDGAVTAPSYSFDNATTTGMFKPTGLTALDLGVNGLNALRFTNDGNAIIARFGSGSDEVRLTTQSERDLVLNTNTGATGGNITITAGANAAIDLSPHGTGLVQVKNLEVGGEYTLPTADGDADQVLTTDGAGAVTFEDAASGKLIQTGDLGFYVWHGTADAGPYGVGTSVDNAADGAWEDKSFGFNFLSAVSGQLAGIGLDFHATAGYEIGIYDIDSDGYPDTLIGKGTLSSVGAGAVTQTSITGPSAGAAGNLVQGDGYWVILVRADSTSNGNVSCLYGGDRSRAAPLLDIDVNKGDVLKNPNYTNADSGTGLPDSYSITGAVPDNAGVPRVFYKVS